MLIHCAYFDTNFPCAFQYLIVLGLESHTMFRPLTFTHPLMSLAWHDVWMLLRICYLGQSIFRNIAAVANSTIHTCSDNVVVCSVIADGKHSYMDLSAENHLKHMMLPPVDSLRWTFTARCHSHITVSHSSLSQCLISQSDFVSNSIGSW